VTGRTEEMTVGLTGEIAMGVTGESAIDPAGDGAIGAAGERAAGEKAAGPAEKSAIDPIGGSVWRRLRILQDTMDAEIARIYAEANVTGLKPSMVMELLRLNARGPMTIRELAESVQRTHSATSQKVAAMRAAGFVRTTAGADARTKKITLTARARRIIGKLAAEWRATEASVAEIEREIPYPLGQVVTDIEEVLRRKSFHDRIAEKLAKDPDWS
jgi:DNA-binding MarR family transcriptional regulator